MCRYHIKRPSRYLLPMQRYIQFSKLQMSDRGGHLGFLRSRVIVSDFLNNSRFRKAQRPSGSFTKYFYFPLNDIGMARKSAHRFGIHDFYNFKALNAFAARYFCLNRRIQEGGLTRCAPYSLSNLSWLTAFSSFFPRKVCFCLPN